MNRYSGAKAIIFAAATAAMVTLTACGQAPQQQAEATEPASAQPAPAQSEPPAQQAQPAPSQPAQQHSQPPRTTPAQRPAPTTTSPAAPPPAKPKVLMVDVPAGTTLNLALDMGLNSKTSLVGDTFTATVLEPIMAGSSESIPAGSKIEGTVTEAVAAKRGAGNAKLSMSFDRLILPDGYQTAIKGSFQEVTESKKKRNAAVIGGSAAGGALLGRILGKDTKGAVIGSIIGGGIGTAVILGKEGEQAKLPADTPFEIRLEEPVQVPQAPSKT